MFSHITIGTQDLTRAMNFYDAATGAAGHPARARYEIRRMGQLAASRTGGDAMGRQAAEWPACQPWQRLDGGLRRTLPRRGE